MASLDSLQIADEILSERDSRIPQEVAEVLQDIIQLMGDLDASVVNMNSKDTKQVNTYSVEAEWTNPRMSFSKITLCLREKLTKWFGLLTQLDRATQLIFTTEGRFFVTIGRSWDDSLARSTKLYAAERSYDDMGSPCRRDIAQTEFYSPDGRCLAVGKPAEYGDAFQSRINWLCAEGEAPITLLTNFRDALQNLAVAMGVRS